MMKKLFILGLFIMCSVLVDAQITVPTSTLPKVGDTIKTMTDNLPMQIDPGTPGPDKSWDFLLEAPFVQNSVFIDASQGDAANQYPRASLLIKGQNGVEAYYSVLNDNLNEEGFYGNDPFGQGITSGGKYTTSYSIKKTPLNYEDQQSQMSTLIFALSTDQLPDTIIDLLPIVPDSIRLRIEVHMESVVDAWGNLMLNNMDYQVLREKWYEERSTFVDAKLGILPWQDISSIINGLLPGLVGSDTMRAYRYFDDTHIQPIVSLEVDESDNVLSADFIPTVTMSPVDHFVDNGRSKLFVYPNPSLGLVRFQFLNFKPGSYTLQVLNILGKPVWNQTLYVDDSRTYPVDFTFLQRGTYLYALSDSQDKRLFTKRLVIIKP